MLRDLPKAMEKTVLRGALRKAAQPILAAAKENVPAGATGNLSDSLKIGTRLKKSQRRYRHRDVVIVFIGSSAPHAHLIEFGTQERYRKRGGSTGSMPAYPFLTKAWDAQKRAALDILVVEIRKKLLSAAKRLRRRAEAGTLSRRLESDLL